MKKLVQLGSFLMLCSSFQAQTHPNAGKSETFINSEGQTVTETQCIFLGITPPMSQWPDADESVQQEAHKRKMRFDNYSKVENSEDKNEAVQSEMGKYEPLVTRVNILGQSGSGFPPDPSGAAGPNHYVQAVNTAYRVYDKNGTAIGVAKNLSTLWAGSSNEGDPIVMYDRHADRWFISQFQSSPNQILIAISQTNDPTGSYYAYAFNLTNFPDYPKYSIWWDAYYMTSNSSHTAVAFNRTKMLAGDQTANMISLAAPSVNSMGFRSVLPADADGPLPPNGTPCYFFNLEDNAFGVAQDQIEISKFTANFTTPGSSSITSSQIIPVPSFDAVFTGGFANIAQPGTTQRIDVIMGVFMYRAQYTRWTNHSSIVLSHAVDMGSNRSAIRWYELRDANNGTFSVYQSGTYDPSSDSRWMSSAAMDNYGNIGMAYSICNSTDIYPGLRFTGRLANDPLGQMTFAEASAIEGGGSQTVTDRFGDYSHLSLDPDGETFWHTAQYFVTGGAKRTRIFSFSIQNPVSLQSPYYVNLEMTVSQVNDLLQVNVKGIHGNEKVQVDLIGMDGRTISTSSYDANSELTHQFDVNSLNSGIYFVRIGNDHFQKVERVFVK